MNVRYQEYISYNTITITLSREDLKQLFEWAQGLLDGAQPSQLHYVDPEENCCVLKLEESEP